MKATQQLKDEHESIKLMLRIMEKISANLEAGNVLNINHYGKIIDFLKSFADKCHHGKEEKILFPALQNHGIPNEGGPIGIMLTEHKIGRKHIKTLSKAFDEYKKRNKPEIDCIILSSKSYVQLLRDQVEKENEVLSKAMNNTIDEYKEGNKSAINSIISSSINYIQLLRNHIEKENNVLFAMADKVLNEEEQSKIFVAFEKLEVEKIGVGKLEKYHQLLKELNYIYL